MSKAVTGLLSKWLHNYSYAEMFDKESHADINPKSLQSYYEVKRNLTWRC